jgi:hypothetical protein
MEDDDQTRKSPIPVPPIPDLAGRELESPIPDSAGIRNREIPRFPIRPGLPRTVTAGNRGPGTKNRRGSRGRHRRGFPRWSG